MWQGSEVAEESNYSTVHSRIIPTSDVTGNFQAMFPCHFLFERKNRCTLIILINNVTDGLNVPSHLEKIILYF